LYKKKPPIVNKIPPTKDPMTVSTVIPVLFFNCGNEDCGVLVFALGCALGILGTGDGGSKDVVQMYSSLLLISSNSI
jgi:hypothetical protein